MSGHINPEFRPSLAPIDHGSGPGKERKEQDPKTPILRFLSGHSEELVKTLLQGNKANITQKSPEFPGAYMRIKMDNQGHVASYTLEFTPEQFTNVLLAAVEGLPKIETGEKWQLVIDPRKPFQRSEVASYELFGDVAKVIEQELANSPLQMQQSLRQLAPELADKAIDERIILERSQFVYGLRALQKALAVKHLRLGLNERSINLLEMDEQIIHDLTQRVVESPAVPQDIAPLRDEIPEEDLRAIREARMDLMFQVTNPSGPHQLTREALEQDIRIQIQKQRENEEKRIRQIVQANTMPMRAVIPQKTEPDNGGNGGDPNDTDHGRGKDPRRRG